MRVFFILISLAFSSHLLAIVGGEKLTRTDELAYSVVQVYSEGFFCTGTLIKEDLIITAAHCLPDEYYHFRHLGVMRGFYKPQVSVSLRNDTAVHIYRAATMIAHEEYFPQIWSRAGKVYDIALIRLTSKVPGAKPLKVLTDPEVDLEGLSMVHSGFGHFDGRKNITHNNDGFLRSVNFHGIKKDFDTLVVSDSERGPCIGDSGGPALIERDGEKVVAGVLSYSFPLKGMSEEQKKVFLGESGQQTNWSALFKAFPDYDECKGGDYVFMSTSEAKDFIEYYQEVI